MAVNKTLVLVFVHGFRGSDGTFEAFPTHLRSLISSRLPQINVVLKVYPQYETRGELADCVSRFRTWLQDLVIDLEVQNESQSPTLHPSVHVMLVGHSMGGIVAAETILSIAAEQLVVPTASRQGASKALTCTFPRIQGLLAFDTPFLGISPSVVSHTAENHYKTVTAAAGTLSELAGAFGWKNAASRQNQDESYKSRAGPATSRKTLPASAQGNNAADAPSWQKYGKYAIFAGAAGALAAGGAAALYANKDKVMEGWSWATGHLEFVNCLAKPELLRKRCLALADVQREQGIGATNFYTALGKGAATAGNEAERGSLVAAIGRYANKAKVRTFCNLPSESDASQGLSTIAWIKAPNEKAADEIAAHTNMFSLKANPDYQDLATRAADQIIQWVDAEWYRSAMRVPASTGAARANAVFV